MRTPDAEGHFPNYAVRGDTPAVDSDNGRKNGRDRHGATPKELALPPGVFGLRLSLDGYQTVEREVTVSAQQSQTVEVTLQRGN